MRTLTALPAVLAATLATGACGPGGCGGGGTGGTGGAAGSPAGGSAGTPTGGAAGSSSGGTAGSSTGGAAGSGTGGSAGTPSGGAAGAGGAGGAGDGGTGGTTPDASTDAAVSLNCGDGIRDPLTEECDDGNASASDSCSACFVQDVLLVPGPGSDGGVPPKVSRRLGDGRHPVAGESGFAVAFVTSLPAPVTLGLLTFDSVGVPASSPVTVAADTSVTANAHPVVAALPVGRYAVAYTDLNADGDGLGIAVRSVDAATKQVSSLVRVNTTKTFGQHDVDLVWTGTELVAAWVDDSKLPTSGADIRMRRFTSSLAPTSSEEILANGPAQESGVALATFGSGWAAAWRSALAGTETIAVKTAGASWSVAVASPGPAEDKPALAELDATHLLLVFSEGTPARLRGAILDTASQTVAPFPIAPSVAPYSTDTSLAQTHPNTVRAGARLFVAWRSALVPGDAKAEELWLKELDWTSLTLDLSKTEITLPRWPSHLKDDQRRPALAATGNGALATAWDDYGRVFGSVEGTPDVVAELVPLPILRKNLPDGGAQ